MYAASIDKFEALAGDVVSAGIVGDPVVGPWEIAITRHAAGDGAERWRYVISNTGSLYQRGVFLARDPAGAYLAASHQRERYQEFGGSVVKVSSDGSKVWAPDSVFDRFSSLAVDSAGDVFAGGELFANEILGFPDFFVVKLAGVDGGEVWRSFVPSLSGHGGHATAVAVDANDDLVAALRPATLATNSQRRSSPVPRVR